MGKQIYVHLCMCLRHTQKRWDRGRLTTVLRHFFFQLHFLTVWGLLQFLQVKYSMYVLYVFQAHTQKNAT